MSATIASTPTTLSALLERLDQLHGDGEAQWLALCPAHDDGSPSLRIALGEPRDDEEYGPVLLHCRANCGKNDVLSALDLTRRDLASMTVDEETWDVPVYAGRVRKGRRAAGTAPYAPITSEAQADLRDRIETRAARLRDDRAGSMPGQLTAADARTYISTRWGLTDAQARYLDLGFEDYRHEHGKRDKGVFVPFNGVRRDEDGTWAFGGPMGYQTRHMNPDTSMKWATPAAPASGAFGWSRIGVFTLPADQVADDTLPVIVTEGPGDALTVAGMGFPAIAVRGASLARNAEVVEEIAAAVRLLAEQRNIDPLVVVAGDGDDAGRAFSTALREGLLRHRLLVSVLELPGGEDITSLRESGRATNADELLAFDSKEDLALPFPWTDLSVPLNDLVHAIPAEVLRLLGMGAPASEPVAAPIAGSRATSVSAVAIGGFGQLDIDPWAHSHTDLGAARLLQQALVQLGTPARHCAQKGGWLIYDPTRGIWTIDASRRLHAVAHRVADALSTKARAASRAAEGMPEDPEQAKSAEAIRALGHRFESTRMTNAALAQLEAILVASPAEFDGDDTRHLLVVGNGVVNLRTSELSPFDAGLMMTVGTEVIFDSAAEAPMWDDFERRASVAAPDEMPGYLRVLAGLMATGYTEQNVHFLLGKGANGKGVWLNVVQAILAGSIVSTGASAFEDASRGEGPTPMLASLEPARGVMVDELKAKAVLDDGRLKALSGDSVITTRRLHQEPHSWTPRFTMVVATNHPPRFSGDAPDYGIRRRVRVIPWLMELTPEQQDPRIVEKLMTEREGILARIIAGARTYFERGLPQARFIEEASREMWQATNPLSDLLEGSDSPFVLAPSESVERGAAYDVYVAWAHKSGQVGTWSRQRFYEALAGFGVELKKSSGRRILVGIGISEHAPKPVAY